MKEVNRNIAEELVKEQTTAQKRALAKKMLKRSKDKANRLRAERKEKGVK
jgi:hypothetical protein